MKRITSLTVATVFLAGCQPAPSNVDGTTHSAGLAPTANQLHPAPFGDRARARLVDTQGVRIGEVFAWQGREGVLIQVRSQGLPPGAHAVHVHAAGSCDDIGSFTASGGHVATDGGRHGFLHPDGTHAGDLPNIYVHNDGFAQADYFSVALTLTDLTDPDGVALIIHAKPDDYQSQPIGGAGVRIACAAFGPSEP